MNNFTLKEWKVQLLATLLMCLMVFGSFTGPLDSSFVPASENKLNSLIREDSAILTLDGPASDWINMAPDVSPSARCSSPLVYDIESDRIVIFGGWQSTDDVTDSYDDTWQYNLNTNIWTNMSPVSAPQGRGAHAMAYDEKHDVVIMFGGSSTGIEEADDYLADTWSYDLNTNSWTNMSPITQPSVRLGSCMQYDNESGVFVMFGGVNPDISTIHETWVYNFTANTWTDMTTVDRPDGRLDGRMTYDYSRDRIMLFSGANFDDGILNDLWEYDFYTNTWVETSPSISPPCGGVISYDKESDILVMYGGAISLYEESINETWIFDLVSEKWIDMNSPNDPPARSRPYLAYDIESNRTVLFGGAHPVTNDTWMYNYTINPPAGPRNIEINPSGDNLVLTWDAPTMHPSVSITGYNVYRGSELGVYTLLVELGDVLTYTDTTVGKSIQYYYAVAAVSTIGEGALSEVDGIVPGAVTDDEIYSFVVYGDTRSSDETAVSSLHDDIVRLYLQKDPEMVIHTGDLVNHGGETYQWPLFEDSISDIWEWDADMTFYSAVGNHERYTDVYGVNDEDYSNYLDYVDFSDVVDETGETELYYSFDWQGIHFIFLNTVEEWTDDVFTCPTAQMEWLESDLAGGHAFIIVSFHNPAYSIRAERPYRWAQSESIRDTFHTLFVDNGVDIVFTGHDHYYYRTVRNEIQYIVTAGGGAPLYELETEGTAWQEGDIGFSEHHYCVASVIDDMLEVKVFLLNGTIADSFSLEIPAGTQFPILMTVGIIGGIAVVAIVIIVIIRKKK